MKRLFIGILCAAGVLGGAQAQAAPILTPTTDGVVSSILFDTSFNPIIFGGISGGSPADVIDGATTVATGGVAADIATDVETDNLYFLDFVDDLIVFDFDFTSSVFSAGGIWTLPAVGTQLIGGSDPALLPFIGTNAAQFSVFGDPVPVFGQEQEIVGFIVTYSLDSISAREDIAAVPEPATLGLVATGMVMAARRRRASRKSA